MDRAMKDIGGLRQALWSRGHWDIAHSCLRGQSVSQRILLSGYWPLRFAISIASPRGASSCQADGVSKTR